MVRTLLPGQSKTLVGTCGGGVERVNTTGKQGEKSPKIVGQLLPRQSTRLEARPSVVGVQDIEKVRLFVEA